ncbi:MAG: hypothetical protein JXB62_18950 [Pirellulales bacterium]|nr:hypothetical protein [Pirellulales bacterium]
MQEVLFEYELNPTTWAYLSSLMTIGIYFKFSRFWSVRNLDLVGLIALAPGLLLLFHGLKKYAAGVESLGHTLEQFGYVWLFSVGAFFLIRLLLDPVMVRRPLLEPNLSASGLTFTAVALLVFLMGNVIAEKRPQRLEDVLPQSPTQPGPGYPAFYQFACRTGGPTARAARIASPPKVNLRQATLSSEAESERASPQAGGDPLLQKATRRTVAILAHLAVLIGVVLIGYRHFDNIHTGLAVASLYLLVFYSSQMVGRVDHVLPAALLVWAVEAYRRPVVAGILIGLAGGLTFYPLFLLPLWCGFYWRRGLIRFAIGLVPALVLLVALLPLGPGGPGEMLEGLKLMFGWVNPLREIRVGFWAHHEPAYRIPVLAASVALCGSLALWPAQKNLGTLLSCSAAVMLAVQFWHPDHGGVYMAWYLPLLLLTVFRPNLEDRVAITALTEGWFRRRPAFG